jgi:L-fuconolactonase
MRVDAHQHFWTYQPERDAWITDDMRVLRRDFLPVDLEPQLAAHKFDGCVVVQADQSETETSFLLSLAHQYDFIKGVVGWIDLQAPDLPNRLTAYQSENKLKGFRHIVQAEPPGFLLQPTFTQGVQLLGRLGYTYDLLVYHHQLPEAVEFVRQLPEQKIVVDHLAKPGVKAQQFDVWATHLRALAQHQHVFCKISGLVTEADWLGWKAADFTRYLQHAVDCFGIDRLLYGSDWPVCLLAASYSQQFEVIERFFDSFSASDKQKVFGENAERFYNLRP